MTGGVWPAVPGDTMASGSGQEVGNWRLEDGDLDDLLERMLQQNAQDQSHTHRLDATHDLLPNIWSPVSDVDVKVEVGTARLSALSYLDSCVRACARCIASTAL